MLALLAALLACEALLGGERSAQAETPGGDDSVIVRFRAGADAADRLAARRGAGAELDRALPLAGLQVVQPRSGLSAEQLVTRLERSDDVLYAEPDARRTAFVVPNDPYMWTLWGLNDTGQSVAGVKGTPDADIDATEAWDLTTGDSAVTVGIVDSGLDATHADLAPNLWANAGESGAGRETNGLDDDGDGQIDDVHGWDWVDDDATPADVNGHGTHVAGTIGARGNDAIGVAGVSWHVSLAPLRVLDATGSGQVSDVIEAYGYARKKGLQIVNASLGGSVGSQAEYDALRVASQTLFVVAAGNGGSDQVGDNNDVTPTYPCAYNLPNILCVAATDQHDALASFSNYGSTAVDLAAPGVTIASSWPGGQWRYMNGTSMATPHVSGAAALVLAESPGATVAQVRAALLAGVDVKPSLTGKTVSGGRLNAFRALGGIPAALTSPPATTPSGSSPAPPAPAAPSARPDTDALSIRVVAVRHVNRRVGMRVRTRCSEACRVTHELVVGSRTARRLGIRAAAGRVLGRARCRLTHAGSVTVRIKLTAAAKRRLRRVRHVTVQVRTRALDRAGNVRTVRRSVRLSLS